MKKQHYVFPKFPKSAVRITNDQGKRVWKMANGDEYESKRAYFEALQEKARKAAQAAGQKFEEQ
jgi:hypothetical protein